MTRYGRSPWVDRFPKSRLPAYPPFQGDLTTQVVIVGGGLTGCLIAYAFAAAGVKATLVEADQIGRGSTAGSLGWIAETPGQSFQKLEGAIGLRGARKAWQAWRRGALDFAALLRRLEIKCALEPRATLHLARTPEQTMQLKRELKSRQDAGLEASLLKARPARQESGTETLAAVRTRDGATIDPFRAALGIVAAAVERGAAVFERSPATKVRFTAKNVEVQFGTSILRADRVVIATGRPTPLFKALVRHFWFQNTFYALTEPIPAKVRRTLGESSLVTIDSAEPAHHIRWVDDDRLLVGGADAPAVPDRQREKVIVQRTGQLMYELSTLYPDISGLPPSHGWDAAYGRTSDGLPYIGPHRNYPRHLFAFGCGSHSVTDAYLASRILLRHYQAEVDPADDVFGFTTERL
jgi:glycine/D-amino acid oxidase-like deaminating enzyme